MYTKYLRDIFPDLVKNLNNEALDKVARIIVATLETRELAVGLIFKESEINETFMEEIFGGIGHEVTPNLKELIQNLFTQGRNRYITIWLPKAEKFNNTVGVWANGKNDKLTSYLKLAKKKNMVLANIEIYYDTINDKILTCGLHYKISGARNWEEYTYSKNNNDAWVLNPQKILCSHYKNSPKEYKDVFKVVHKWPNKLFAFESMERNNGISAVIISPKRKRV